MPNTSNVYVAVRIVPCDIGSSSVSIHSPSPTTIVISMPVLRPRLSLPPVHSAALASTRSYDHVFSREASQHDVYTRVCAPLVKNFLAGYDCTIFAHGQSFSGKTHSIMGPLPLSPQLQSDSGLVPRAIRAIFKGIEELGPGVKADVTVTFLELYNEEWLDLLQTCNEKTRPKVCKGHGHKVVVKDAHAPIVTTPEDLMRVLNRGSRKMTTHNTPDTKLPSQSHTVITVNVTQSRMVDKQVGEWNVKRAKFQFVDLAAGNRLGLSEGAMQKHSISINKSLFVLDRVVAAAGSRQLSIPYRESQLARLLQDSLGGDSFTAMIACVNPGCDHLTQTVATLGLASRARKITNSVSVQEERIGCDKVARLQARVAFLLRNIEEGVRSKRYGDREEDMNRGPKLLELRSANSVLRAEHHDLLERYRVVSELHKKQAEKLSSCRRTISQQECTLLKESATIKHLNHELSTARQQCQTDLDAALAKQSDVAAIKAALVVLVKSDADAAMELVHKAHNDEITQLKAAHARELDALRKRPRVENVIAIVRKMEAPRARPSSRS